MTHSEQFLAGEHEAGRLAEGTEHSDTGSGLQDQRLIEAGFPCHQVGAETQREKGASNVMPPVFYLHVWWARRPLTPSRAAVLASLAPANTDPEQFVRGLGIECLVADVRGVPWVIDDDKVRQRVSVSENGRLGLNVDRLVVGRLEKERERRAEHRELIEGLEHSHRELFDDPVLTRWKHECIDLPHVEEGEVLTVQRGMGDPAWAKERIEFETKYGIRTKEDKYKYPRAFGQPVRSTRSPVTVLDPTAGGGSIPFEALRLGHRVIANELNPVASVILKATVDYPARFGPSLVDDVDHWGAELRKRVVAQLEHFFPASSVPAALVNVPAGVSSEEENLLHSEQLDGYLYCRQVVCPHCGGDAPLLNSCWLSKQGGKWGIKIKPQPDGAVQFEPYQIGSGIRGPNGEDPETRTVTRGVGQCVHCHQAIDGDEIKRQARGDSEFGQWKDRLYCVVGIRREAKLDKNGRVQRFTSGRAAGDLKTRKVPYFRAPNSADLEALEAAETELENRRTDFEMKGVVPNEAIPRGSKTSEPLRYGMSNWVDMFTPRQLLGHLVLMGVLQEVKAEVLQFHGEERGRAVVTYLQFIADKLVDYNSRQTRWEFTRGVVKGTFGRHDFSLKWTFGELAMVGAESGIQWALSQVPKALGELVELLPRRSPGYEHSESVKISNGSATEMGAVESGSVDAIVMDPPYYDNVQYSELSDFYYVWQKRTLGDLYPGWFTESVTDKTDEAVANPARDGSARSAKARYEELMKGIFAECRRVLRPDGIMTLMFTHKSQDAWETLTNALIQSNWDITAAMPVESESGHSTHQMNMAAAASSIFIACRPANRRGREATSWSFGGGVKVKLEAAVREGLQEFERLNLNPVDRMVASWGRALRVYSAHWPVIDGEEEVTPTRAMQEAARVVAEEEVGRLSGGLVTVGDLDAESRLAVIALGINGLGEFAFDDGLQVTRSLNLALQMRNGNYRVDNETVVYANEADGQLAAPLAKKGSRLRLLKPEERLEQRLDNPQTLWDTLCGLIVNYREGGVVAARNYLTANNQRESEALRGLLKVWAKECRDDALRREALLIDYEL